ncbi:Nuclear GTP-binding protein NUG1 [Ceratocystis lukuohia]|uniref:Nuclear GTP-binding protein NUG1 n=1 Tax=Ceratocystis lukuohia TaxID=2019550 RepID=A0ABR4MNA8_9PEZI
MPYANHHFLPLTLSTEPTSKRSTTRLRANIKKASSSKQRKDRKLAKKNPQWKSKLKKDPGIPNLFPYKERILQEIEETRIQKANELQRRKEAAKAAKAGDIKGTKTGNSETQEDNDELDDMAMDEDDEDFNDEDVDSSNPMAALLASARRAAEDYERQLAASDDGMSDEEASDIEIGSDQAASRRAYDKVFKDVVDRADVVLYVLDARDPEGTRSRDVERSVMAAANGGKRLILILNKVDLVPPKALRDWLAHLRRFFPTLPLRASIPAPNAQTFTHKDMTVQSTSAALFRALKSYAASRQLKRAVSVGVIGYPNVGKSSVINALLARMGGKAGLKTRACPAGAEAGVTTAIRQVKIDSKLTLLDSPGIIFPSTGRSTSTAGSLVSMAAATQAHAQLVLLNAVPPKQIDDPVPAVTLLLQRLSEQPALLEKLLDVYDIPPLVGSGSDLTTDFLVQVARKRGRLSRGGVPNLKSAAMTVITDWRDGRIQGWAEAPVLAVEGVIEASASANKTADEPAADQKQIVTEWAAEFKLDGLWGDDSAAAETDDVMQE